MMNKVFLLLMAIGLLSCEKGGEPDEEIFPLEHPSTYTGTHVESKSNVRVFTSQGEITDNEIVSKFIQRHGENYLFKSGYRLERSANRLDSIQIQSESVAKIKGSSQYNWKNFSLRKTGNVLEFIGKDTIFAYSDEHATRLSNAFYKHSYEFSEIRRISGGSSIMRFVDTRVAQMSANHLRLPKLNFVMIYKNGGISKIFGIDNDLKAQPDYRQLVANDTIALQAFDLVLEKK